MAAADLGYSGSDMSASVSVGEPRRRSARDGDSGGLGAADQPGNENDDGKTCNRLRGDAPAGFLYAFVHDDPHFTKRRLSFWRPAFCPFSAG